MDRLNLHFIALKKKLSSRFQTFCEETSMHGFVEINRTKRNSLKLLWLCLVFVVFGMLTLQLYGSINQFILQPTITSIQAATEKDIIYPPLKYCITEWFYWFSDRNLKTLSRPALLLAFSRLGTVYSEKEFSISEAEINLTRYFEERQKLKIDGSNYTFEDFFIENSRKLNIFPRNMFLDKELYVVNQHDNYIFMCFTINETSIKSRLKDNVLSFANFDTYRYSFSNLFRSFTEDELYQEQLRSFVFRYTDPRDSFKSNQTKSSDLLDFFYKYRSDILYVDSFNQLYFTVSTNVMYYSIQLRSSIRKSMPGLNKDKCKMGKKTLFAKETCEQKCRSFMVANQSSWTTCKKLATIIILNEKPSSIKYVCKKSIYFKEKDKQNLTWREQTFPTSVISHDADIGSLQNCVDKCREGCEKWKWKLTVSIIGFSHEMGSFHNIEINYPSTDNVIILQELESKTWEDFIGIVGGTMGVWTGASILSIFQLIYFLCCPHYRMTTSENVLVHLSLKRKNALQMKHPFNEDIV